MSGLPEARTEASFRCMQDFEIRQTPTLIPHVLSQHAQTLALDFAGAAESVRWANELARSAVRKRRKDKAVPVAVGLDQEDCRSDGVQTDRFVGAAEVFKQFAPVIGPAIAIESRAARRLHTMRVKDVEFKRQQLPDQSPRIGNDVDIEPQYPILVLQRSKQQLIAGSSEYGAADTLKGRSPAGNAGWQAKIEIPLDDRDPATPRLQPWKQPF
jgi:hypothetical protein